MLNLYLTKDLYLVGLARITKMIKNSKYPLDFTCLFDENDIRYTIVKYKRNGEPIDIFTNTNYFMSRLLGSECIVYKKAIITDKRVVSKKELINILKELNPTYLSSYEVKTLTKTNRK